jgi:type IV pilus assembly protein PilA
MRWGRLRRGQRGFTLLELLVVLLIIAILAALAIPLFIKQRDKAEIAQVQSVLANAKLIAESYYVENEESYVGLDCNPCTLSDAIYDEGLRATPEVELLITATAQTYCIVSIHLLLPAGPWKVASVGERSKAPSSNDPPCPT